VYILLYLGVASLSKKEGSEQEFNVLEHVYVPKHEIVSASDVEDVLRKYNAIPEQFPYILASDPVIKVIMAKPGDLIKITRKSETAGETIYYRFVVDG
jgi:DNA-directed RNA polymerase subunit H